MTTQTDKANRALYTACMGNLSMAANWLKTANEHREIGRTEAQFIETHGKHGNAAKARAAYRLAVANAETVKAPVNRIAGKCLVNFTREFTAGPLIGIKAPDKINHVDRWHAAQWLKGIRRNVRAGRLEYRLIAVTV